MGDAEVVTGLTHNAMTVRRPTDKADHLRFLFREAGAVDIVIPFNVNQAAWPSSAVSVPCRAATPAEIDHVLPRAASFERARRLACTD